MVEEEGGAGTEDDDEDGGQPCGIGSREREDTASLVASSCSLVGYCCVCGRSA